MKYQRITVVFFLLLLMLFLNNCSSSNQTVRPKSPVDDSFNQAYYAFSQGNYKEAKRLFIKHVRDNGVAQTDAVKLLKKHEYKKTADIPQARLEFFKSEITRLGQEASTND